MSRADKITPLTKMPEYHSDFQINMDKNPVTGQLAVLTNADALSQSIRNLVLTDPKERPYQPHLGCAVRESLFDLIDDPIAIENIKNSVRDTIETNEPRVKIVGVEVRSMPDQSGYILFITFTIINTGQTITSPVFISRVR